MMIGKINRKRILGSIFLLALICVFSMQVFAGEYSDIENHWANASIEKLMGADVINGYPDGTFRPDGEISRAEFAKIINHTFGFFLAAEESFSDVSADAWYCAEIKEAKCAGYMSGYSDGTFRPDQKITRQEVAAALVKMLQIKLDENYGDLVQYTDVDRMAQWSKPYINIITQKGYMSGYPDGSFGADKNITRAEAVTLINNIVGEMYRNSGEFGENSQLTTIDGNVLITSDGVVLNNFVISGDLIIGAGVGGGEVTLNNVTVEGTTYVQGGGENSLVLNNTSLQNVIVYKVDGKVRIVATGSSSIGETSTLSSVKLQEQGLTGDGFKEVEIISLAPGETLELDGDFESIDIGSEIDLQITDDTKVGTLNVGQTATNVKVTVDSNASIGTLTVNAPADIGGSGKIENAEIYANDVTIEQEVKNVTLGENVTSVTVAGKTPVTTTVTVGGGGGGGDSYSAPVVSQVTASPVSGSIAAGTLIGLSTQTADATIYYTVDGTTPTTSSILYATPIEVKANTQIKAIAVRSGYTNSNVATFNYTIGSYLGFTYSYQTVTDGAAPVTGVQQVERFTVSNAASANGTVTFSLSGSSINVSEDYVITAADTSTAGDIALGLKNEINTYFTNNSIMNWAVSCTGDTLVFTKQSAAADETLTLIFDDGGTGVTVVSGQRTAGVAADAGTNQVVTVTFSGNAQNTGKLQLVFNDGAGQQSGNMSVVAGTTASAALVTGYENALSAMTGWTASGSGSVLTFTRDTKAANVSPEITLNVLAVKPSETLVNSVMHANHLTQASVAVAIAPVPDGYVAQLGFADYSWHSASVQSGSSTITAPATDGVYYLYLVDKNDSSYYNKGTYTVTVDNVAPAAPTITGSPANDTPTNGSVTVTITAEASAVIKYKLTGDLNWTTYSGAFTVDANTTVTATATDLAGNESTQATLTISNIDKIAPAAPTITGSPTTLTNGSVTVTITAEASATIKYQIDGGAVTTYTAPFTVDSNKTVTATATDLAGNESTQATLVISNIDKTAPDAPTITGSPANTTPTNGSVTVTITAEANATIKYQIDGGAVTTYTAPFTLDSNKTVTATATDLAGNESVEASLTISNIDKTAPTVTITGAADGETYGANKTITASTNEGTITAATVNGTNALAAITGSGYTTTVGEETTGEYTIAVTAVDTAGNSTTETITFTVDTRGPVITFSGASDNGVYGSDTSVTIAVAPGGPNGTTLTGYDVKVNDVSQGEVASYTALAVDAQETDYTITVTATNSLNVATSESITITIDKLAPAAPTIAASPENGPVKTVDVTITDAESGVTIEYKLGDSSWTTYTDTFTVTDNVTITARATDSFGNISTSATKTIDYIDNVAPVITLNGDATVSVVIAHNYTEAGATATDNIDGSVTVSTSYEKKNGETYDAVASIDTSAEAEYRAVYTATDTAGNTQTAYRTVTIDYINVTGISSISNVDFSFDITFDHSFDITAQPEDGDYYIDITIGQVETQTVESQEINILRTFDITKVTQGPASTYEFTVDDSGELASTGRSYFGQYRISISGSDGNYFRAGDFNFAYTSGLTVTPITLDEATIYNTDTSISGTTTAGATVTLYIVDNGTLSQIAQTTATGGIFALDNLSGLNVGDVLAVTAKADGAERSDSAIRIVTLDERVVAEAANELPLSGQTFAITLDDAQDLLSGDKTVSVTSNVDGAVGGGTLTFVNGSASVNATLTTYGEHTLTIAIAGVDPQQINTVSVTVPGLAPAGKLLDADGDQTFIGVVYTDNTNLYYAKQINGLWYPGEKFAAGTVASIAIDDNNVPHIAYVSSEKIAYITKSDGDWTTPEILGNGTCSYPDIAVDSSGYTHIVFSDTAGNGDNDVTYHDGPDSYKEIVYATNSGGSFVETIAFDGYRNIYSGTDYYAAYYDHAAKISVDDSGNYYIAVDERYIDKWYNGSYTTYKLIVKSESGTANWSDTSDNNDVISVYDFATDGTKVYPVFAEDGVTMVGTVSGTTWSGTDVILSTATAGRLGNSGADTLAYSYRASDGKLTTVLLYQSLTNSYTHDEIVLSGASTPIIDDSSPVVVYTNGTTSEISVKAVQDNPFVGAENVPTLMNVNAAFGSLDIGMSMQNIFGTTLNYSDIVSDLNTMASTITISDADGVEQDITLTFGQLASCIDAANNLISFDGDVGFNGSATGEFSTGLLSGFVPFDHDTITVYLEGSDWNISATAKIPYMQLTPAQSGDNLNITVAYEASYGQTMDLTALDAVSYPIDITSAVASDFATAFSGAVSVADVSSSTLKLFAGGDITGVSAAYANVNADNETLTISAARQEGVTVDAMITLFVLDGSTGTLNSLSLRMEGAGAGTDVLVSCPPMVEYVTDEGSSYLNIGFDSGMGASVENTAFYTYQSVGGNSITFALYDNTQNKVGLSLNSAVADGDIIGINVYDEQTYSVGILGDSGGELISMYYQRTNGVWNTYIPQQGGITVALFDTEGTPQETFNMGDMIAVAVTDPSNPATVSVNIHTETGDPTGTTLSLAYDSQSAMYSGVFMPTGNTTGVNQGGILEVQASTDGDTVYVSYGGETASVTINAVSQSPQIPDGLDLSVGFGSLVLNTVPTLNSQELTLDGVGAIDYDNSSVTFSDYAGQETPITLTFTQLSGDANVTLNLSSNTITLSGEFSDKTGTGIFAQGQLLGNLVYGSYDTVSVSILGTANETPWTITGAANIPYLYLTNPTESGNNLAYDINNNYEITVSGSYTNVTVPGQSFTGEGYDTAYSAALASAVSIGDIDQAGDGLFKAFYVAPNTQEASTENLAAVTVTLSASNQITVSAQKTDDANSVNAQIFFYVYDSVTHAEVEIALSITSEAGSSDILVREMTGGPSEPAEVLGITPSSVIYDGDSVDRTVYLTLEYSSGDMVSAPSYTGTVIKNNTVALDAQYYAVDDTTGQVTIASAYLDTFQDGATVTLTVEVTNEATGGVTLSDSFIITIDLPSTDTTPPAADDPAVSAFNNNGNDVYDAGDDIGIYFSEPIKVSNFTDISDLQLSSGTWGDTALSDIEMVNLLEGYASGFEIAVQANANIPSGATITIVASKVEDAAGNTAESDIVFTLPTISSGPLTLAIPSNLAWSGNAMTWDDVENESSYYIEVYQDGNYAYAAGTTANTTTLLLNATYINAPGSYTFKVKAVGDGTTTLDSDLSALSSALVKTQLARVTGVALSDQGIVTWTDVDNESSYKVSIYKTSGWLKDVTVSADVTTADLKQDFIDSGAEHYSVSVTSLGNGVNYLNGNVSSIVMLDGDTPLKLVDLYIPHTATPELEYVRIIYDDTAMKYYIRWGYLFSPWEEVFPIGGVTISYDWELYIYDPINYPDTTYISVTSGSVSDETLNTDSPTSIDVNSYITPGQSYEIRLKNFTSSDWRVIPPNDETSFICTVSN